MNRSFRCHLKLLHEVAIHLGLNSDAAASVQLILLPSRIHDPQPVRSEHASLHLWNALQEGQEVCTRWRGTIDGFMKLQVHGMMRLRHMSVCATLIAETVPQLSLNMQGEIASIHWNSG